MDHAGNLNRMGGMKPLLVGKPRCDMKVAHFFCFFLEMFLEFKPKMALEAESMKQTTFLPFLEP